jgi:proline iminopeptidase
VTRRRARRATVATGDGVSLFYEAKGRGEPLYVLHGGPGMSHRYFLGYLDGLEAVRKVHYWDLRGHGQSDKAPPKSYTLSRLAQDVEDVRRALGHGPIDVLGHSMGGFVACQWAVRYPQSVRSLIVVASSPRLYLRGYLRMFRVLGLNRGRAVAAGFGQLLWKLLRRAPEEERLAALDRFYDPIYIGDFRYVDELHSASAAAATPNFDGYWPLWMSQRRHDVVRDLTRLRLPILAVVGAKDAFFGPEAEVWSRIPGARVVVMPEVGHNPFIEAQEEFNRIVVGFLREGERATQ